MFGKKKKKIIKQIETPIEVDMEEKIGEAIDEPREEIEGSLLQETELKKIEKPIKANKNLRKIFERNTKRIESIKKSSLRVSER